MAIGLRRTSRERTTHLSYPITPLSAGPQASVADELPADEILFGVSEAMARVRLMLSRVASTRIPALVYGESGTGKQLIARALHAQSPWKDAPFVQVNCPSLPANLVESELFGYEPGAFTGAIQTKPGRVEMADGGTLFLDEIGDFALELQAKLLQLLQDGHFARIGGSAERVIQARIVCATNRDLERDIERGLFRRDLYYRISALVIVLPPLRQRAEDIPGLVQYFLRLYSERYQRPVPPLASASLRQLCEYSWPGNVRQLQNLIKRLVILGTEDVIAREMAPRSQEELGLEFDQDSELSLKEITRQTVEKVERVVIARTLQKHNWSRRRTSNSLQISYRALLYKIKKLELPSKRTPNSAPSEIE